MKRETFRALAERGLILDGATGSNLMAAGMPRGVSSEDCYRAFLLANDLLCGEYSSVIFQVAGVHGGGSPIMEDIAILGSYDMRKRINIAKHLAGIEITDDDKK